MADGPDFGIVRHFIYDLMLRTEIDSLPDRSPKAGAAHRDICSPNSQAWNGGAAHRNICKKPKYLQKCKLLHQPV
jgi:hypothetical protein